MKFPGGQTMDQVHGAPVFVSRLPRWGLHFLTEEESVASNGLKGWELLQSVTLQKRASTASLLLEYFNVKMYG